MEAKTLPEATFPREVPLKVFGSASETHAHLIAELIHTHLNNGTAQTLPQSWEQDYRYFAHTKGAWISHTFWVTLPHEDAERPLREAIQKLHGVVMQL